MRVLRRQAAGGVMEQEPEVVCRSTRELSSLIVDVPLLPPIDQ